MGKNHLYLLLFGGFVAIVLLLTISILITACNNGDVEISAKMGEGANEKEISVKLDFDGEDEAKPPQTKPSSAIDKKI